jgi:ribosomal protein L1
MLFTTGVMSCKKTFKVAPAESPEIQNLKQFYAKSANVPIEEVNYDQSRDEFNINGNAALPHYKLSILSQAVIARGAARSEAKMEKDSIKMQ